MTTKLCLNEIFSKHVADLQYVKGTLFLDQYDSINIDIYKSSIHNHIRMIVNFNLEQKRVVFLHVLSDPVSSFFHASHKISSVPYLSHTIKSNVSNEIYKYI